ncbi:hypothetical protein Rrhod_0627 [Rhodococcus rhodnii LMG 5362]|uniref:Uncharacterized protein n=1 Tax=Rhodococcus rhodnii LMG 5362 TaxID=1273125 RepID=R7WRK7_9NOCA|nr:hypothetical protein Rrhod_0627 [Rhodococcus rhodnii LMG 5362]
MRASRRGCGRVVWGGSEINHDDPPRSGREHMGRTC